MIGLDATIMMWLLILAGLYMAWNIGANDVANAMGTSVGSGALKLRHAVYIAAVLEFAGAVFFGSHVSETIQNGIIDANVFAGQPMQLVYGMFASLLAAGLWLQLASYNGWPVSTTHTIVGAVIGFGAIVGGMQGIYWENVAFIVSSWVLSPLLGGLFSFLIFNLLRRHIFYATDPVAVAKRLTPPIAFLVVFILAQIMIYSGLKNFSVGISFWSSMTLSGLLGLITAIIAFFLLKRLKSPKIHPQDFNPEVSHRLERAIRHLEQLQVIAKGDLQVQTTQVLSELGEMSASVRTEKQLKADHSEYALVERIFGYLQIMSACLMAFAHGTNDVANAIGPLSAGLNILSTGTLTENSTIPLWILVLGGIGIVVGLATWGWRVIETIGKKITELTPTRGFAAEFGAAATILLASRLGLPVSTTHTLVGSVIGVGLARGIQALDLGTTRDIFYSWMVTVPAGAALAILIYYPINFLMS